MKTSVYKRIAQIAVLSLSVAMLLGADGDVRFRNLGHKLMCKCGCNQILLECNHVGCTYSDRMRNELMAGLTRGDSDTQVQQWFVQEYGLTVLAAPVNRGFGRVAWVTPFAVFLGALLIAALLIRNWRQRPLAAASGNVLAQQELGIYREQARKETEI